MAYSHYTARLDALVERVIGKTPEQRSQLASILFAHTPHLMSGQRIKDERPMHKKYSNS